MNQFGPGKALPGKVATPIQIGQKLAVASAALFLCWKSGVYSLVLPAFEKCPFMRDSVALPFSRDGSDFSPYFLGRCVTGDCARKSAPFFLPSPIQQQSRGAFSLWYSIRFSSVLWLRNLLSALHL
jgi:hypothetical protein